MGFIKEAYTEYIETCHHYHDIYPEERVRDATKPADASTLERPVTPEDLSIGAGPSRSNVSPLFSLGFRKIIEIQIQMPHIFFSVQQIITLLNYFPPDESYLRVMLIQTVFSHIVDAENMYLIVDNVLTDDERREVFHRIGIMNLLDPMKPDRCYQLDLRRIDHREWAKILIALAIAEPGDNWENSRYRWGKYDDPVPGWTLPAAWCNPDDGGNNGGPRTHGILELSYRSHGNGCMPVISVRKNLRKKTFVGMKRII